MAFVLILTALAVGLSFKAVLTLIQHFSSPLLSVKGPWLANFTSGWYAWKVSQGEFQRVNRDLHDKYGSIVRYGPNRYSISDLGAVKTIYGIGSSFPKSSWYSSWTAPGQHNLFADQDIQRHANDRKQFQAIYSMSSLVCYEPLIDECASEFKTRLTELGSLITPIDMRHWFQCYAFDVIGNITFGKRLGFLDRGDDVDNLMSTVDESIDYSTLVGIFPSLHQIQHSLKSLTPLRKSARAPFIIQYTQDKILETLSNPKAHSASHQKTSLSETAPNLVNTFSTKHTNNPESFTKFHILSGCTFNMIAGSDTTAISLSAVLYYLLKNPGCLQRLRDEIDQFSANGQLSDKPTYKESLDMPYLQAVIKEALRLHPATGLPLERVVPRGGATIAGRFFPEGTIVGINTWVAHYDRDVFGQDVDVFSPERWLQEDSQKVSNMTRFWMPFGLGSRTCIGRHVSILEMCKLVPLLVRDFDFTLEESLRNRDWTVRNCWFMKPVDFKVHVQPRPR